MFKQCADIQTADMLKLPVPEITGGKPTIVKLPPSELQRQMVAALGERAEAVRNRLVAPNEDNMTAAAERFFLAAFLSARSRALALPRSQRSTLISACRFASCIRIAGSRSVRVRYHFEWKNRSSFFLLDRCFHSSGSCTSLNSAFR